MSPPPLPSIDDHEIFLEVHTHRDLKPPAQDLQWGDGERLADLGAKALDAVVTYHFFEQRPCLSAEDIAANRIHYTSATMLNTWLDCYNLKRKLRVAPAQSDAILSDPDEMKTYFHTYVGALCATKGLPPIQNWISKLIDPTSNPEHFPALAQQSVQDGIGSQNSFTQSQTSYHSPQFPLPPAGPPPPLPSSPLHSSLLHSSSFASTPFSLPPSPQVPLAGPNSLISLALVNQTAVQKGYSINYAASMEGPPHQPVWTVECLINNVKRGEGTGKNQKLAKEAAARAAWGTMKWGFGG